MNDDPRGYDLNALDMAREKKGSAIEALTDNLSQTAIDINEIAGEITALFSRQSDHFATVLADMERTSDTWQLAAQSWQRENDEAYLDYTEKLADLEHENGELRRRINFTVCAYCGYEIPLATPEAADLVGKHIAECEKHPMSKLKSRLAEQQAVIEAVGRYATSKNVDNHDAVLEAYRQMDKKGEDDAKV